MSNEARYVPFDGDETAILRVARAVDELWDTPEFKTFLSYLQECADIWGTSAMRQAVEPMDLVKREFDKGVLFGLRMTMEARSRMLGMRDDLLRARGAPSSSGPQPPKEDESSDTASELNLEKGAP